jgi:hypothetical protein
MPKARLVAMGGDELEGSRFRSYPWDLTPFFWARLWPQIILNRRLPRTTQRAVCLLVRETNDHPTLGETPCWAIRGSRLFNPMVSRFSHWEKICEVLWHVLKRLPSSGRCRPFSAFGVASLRSPQKKPRAIAGARPGFPNQRKVVLSCRVEPGSSG